MFVSRSQLWTVYIAFSVQFNANKIHIFSFLQYVISEHNISIK